MAKVNGINTSAKWNGVLQGITDFKVESKAEDKEVTDSLTTPGEKEFISLRKERTFSFNGFYNDASGSIQAGTTGSFAVQLGAKYISGSAVMLTSAIDGNINDGYKVSYSGKFTNVFTETSGSI